MPLAAQLDKEHRFPAEQVRAAPAGRWARQRRTCLFRARLPSAAAAGPPGPEAKCTLSSGLAENLSLGQLVGEFFECGGCNAHRTFSARYLYLCFSVSGFSTIAFSVLSLTYLWALIQLTYKINEILL